ncbi:MAG: hypothetical protein WC717_04035 [Candidatus Micrarchaeia archaeon]
MNGGVATQVKAQAGQTRVCIHAKKNGGLFGIEGPNRCGYTKFCSLQVEGHCTDKNVVRESHPDDEDKSPGIDPLKKAKQQVSFKGIFHEDVEVGHGMC